MAKYKLLKIPKNYFTNPNYEGMFKEGMVVDGEKSVSGGKDVIKFKLTNSQGRTANFTYLASETEEVTEEQAAAIENGEEPKSGMSKNTKYIMYGAAALLVFLFVVKPLFAKSE